MNKNQKEKPARIEIRASQKDKDRITKTADQCGLSITEYEAECSCKTEGGLVSMHDQRMRL